MFTDVKSERSMKVLVLGGTGAMGIPLVDKLSENNTVYVTSRGKKDSTKSVKYIQGNATNKEFVENILRMEYWDAVVDFMVRTTDNLKDLLPKFLENTRQYIFISSARVYSQTDGLITEQTPRLLDVCTDEEYLKTNEYALAKAREENLLLNSEKKNFTIIRPTITYNTQRLQLGVLEKESWLYRALRGRSIVFSEDISNKLTTMTFGYDVSMGIASIIGQENALGEAFHVTSPISLPWSEVLKVYKSVLEKHLGRTVPILMTEKSTNLKFKWRIYQVIYCRYFNRTFDNSKIGQFCDIAKFTEPQKGLAMCLENFLKEPNFGSIPWDIEAVNDRASGEFTPLKEIPTWDSKITYLCYRYKMTPLLSVVKILKSVVVKIKNTIKR